MGCLRRVRTQPLQWTDDHQRPRVLVEDPDGAVRWAMTCILERAGYQTQTCAGPTQQRCRLLEGQGCPLAEGADVIWNHLGSRGASGAVLEHVLASAPGTPVVVEIPSKVAAGPILDAPGVTSVSFPVTPEEVISTVARLIELTPEPARDAFQR